MPWNARTRNMYIVPDDEPLWFQVVTFAPTVPQGSQLAPPFVDRSMRKPDSLSELSVHVSLMVAGLSISAARAEGAAGGGQVVTSTAPVYVLWPAPSYARTR